MFPGANPFTPEETQRQPGRRAKGRRPGPNGRGTHTAPPIVARPNQKSRFRFRQNAASRHVSDLSSPERHHSDRLAGLLTLFRVPRKRRGLAFYVIRVYANTSCKICQGAFSAASGTVLFGFQGALRQPFGQPGCADPVPDRASTCFRTWQRGGLSSLKPEPETGERCRRKGDRRENFLQEPPYGTSSPRPFGESAA